MFKYGTTALKELKESNLIYPDKKVLTLKALDKSKQRSSRKAVFNSGAIKALDLFKTLGKSDEEKPVYTNTTISRARVSNVSGLEDHYIFVNNDVETVGNQTLQFIRIGRTTMGFNDKSLYEDLIKRFDLDDSQDNHFELIRYTGDEGIKGIVYYKLEYLKPKEDQQEDQQEDQGLSDLTVKTTSNYDQG